MTQKEFKEGCSFHTYTGWNGRRTRHNVIYYDWKSDDTGRGYKFALALDIKSGTKADLIRHAFDWIMNEIEPPYFVRYLFASEDKYRFKVPLSLTF